MNAKTTFIRKAVPEDAVRIAEIEVFNYRLNFYPIFRCDDFYFNELNVPSETKRYSTLTDSIYVYDDGAVKGFILLDGKEVVQLFTEPVVQGQGIGSALLESAVEKHGSEFLYVLEKNSRAANFYTRHGFNLTEDKKYEDGTEEFLVKMVRS
ncbi:MAG: GNAT family N-acetyltransferase [Oscillospiraceae bacterium]|nr:GNAT family N-acetyltransferase [Oscillospiraceae bacterium]